LKRRGLAPVDPPWALRIDPARLLPVSPPRRRKRPAPQSGRARSVSDWSPSAWPRATEMPRALVPRRALSVSVGRRSH